MITINLNSSNSKIKINCYMHQIDHDEHQRVHEITFIDGRKTISLALDRLELQELIGVLELIKEMKL